LALEEDTTMSRIRFLCSCGHTVWAPEALAGKKAKCPNCGQVLVVPPVAPPAPSLDGQPPGVPQKSDAPKYPYAHYIIEAGTLNVVIERERLESSLNSFEIQFLLDLSEDNVQELLRNGRTTVTQKLSGGRKEAVTMKGCNCQNMHSHQRGGAMPFQM